MMMMVVMMMMMTMYPFEGLYSAKYESTFLYRLLLGLGLVVGLVT